MKLARVNTALVVIIVIVNTYTLSLPLLPQISFWRQNRSPEASQKLSQQIHKKPAPTKNLKAKRLIVPAMLLDQPVFESKDKSALKKGLWLRPNTSTPDKGGNTVIVGHRFTYTNPQGTLYFLNKVAPGDELALIWQSKTYLYKVETTKVVSADAKEIEDQTPEAQLTLYTCTPLWNPKDRLVVIAKLEAVNE